jgi:tripartite-type tricarboxylate transporter receptor subunit TctC
MHFLRLSALALSMILWLGAVHQACAEGGAYPARPIKVIIPTATGGGTDLSFRALAEGLEPILGQKFVIVNRPGDSGADGLWEIANAEPDGYTLGAAFNGPLTASPHVRKLPYSPAHFTFIASTFETPYVLCVRKEFPAATGPQLVNLLRQKPLAYSYGSDGKGGSGYFAAERLFDALGIVLRSEAFNNSADAAANLVSGSIDVYIGAALPIMKHVRSDAVKCPAVLSAEALPILHGASGPAAFGAPGMEASLWRMLLGPKGLPEDRAARLEAAVKAAMASAPVKAFLASHGERAAVRGISETSVRLWQEYAANAELADRLLLAREPAAGNLSALNSTGSDLP